MFPGTRFTPALELAESVQPDVPEPLVTVKYASIALSENALPAMLYSRSVDTSRPRQRRITVGVTPVSIHSFPSAIGAGGGLPPV